MERLTNSFMEKLREHVSKKGTYIFNESSNSHHYMMAFNKGVVTFDSYHSKATGRFTSNYVLLSTEDGCIELRPSMEIKDEVYFILDRMIKEDIA